MLATEAISVVWDEKQDNILFAKLIRKQTKISKNGNTKNMA